MHQLRIDDCRFAAARTKRRTHSWDKFLFSREEIVKGLEDAMKTVHMEIPEHLRI